MKEKDGSTRFIEPLQLFSLGEFEPVSKEVAKENDNVLST